MKIREVDSRPTWQKDPEAVAEVQHLQKSLRTALDRNQRSWDQGFACAVDMLARGATLDDLRSKIRKPQEVPVFARGTMEFTDTRPIVIRCKLPASVVK